MDLGLTDRVFIVTGGARGLGKATAQVLVDEGACVVVSGRSEASLTEAGIDLGERAVTVVADNARPGHARHGCCTPPTSAGAASTAP